MKKSISLILCIGITFFVTAQIDVNPVGRVGINSTTPSHRLHVRDNFEIQLLLENSNSDGAGLLLENSNNHDYTLINESNNYWGHTNTFDIRSDDGHICFQVFPDHHINLNGEVWVDFNTKVHYGSEASYQQAAGYDINPGSNQGLIIEQGTNEGSGFYADDDFAAIWSPGDLNRLLRVYDEDGPMQEMWYLDGSGVAHTVSDS